MKANNSVAFFKKKKVYFRDSDVVRIDSDNKPRNYSYTKLKLQLHLQSFVHGSGYVMFGLYLQGALSYSCILKKKKGKRNNSNS